MALNLAVTSFFLLLAYTLTHGAVWSGSMDAKPGFPDHCYHKHGDDLTTFFPVGGTFYNTQECYKIECSGGAGRLHIEGYSCGVVGTAAPCHVTGIRVGRKYPDCCPTVECPEVDSEQKPSNVNSANELFKSTKE